MIATVRATGATCPVRRRLPYVVLVTTMVHGYCDLWCVLSERVHCRLVMVTVVICILRTAIFVIRLSSVVGIGIAKTKV